MPLNPALEAKLAQLQPPSARLDDHFRGKDITYLTNKAGQAVTLFVGKRNPDGSIAGERYVRHLQYAPDGVTLVKSHWDNKGQVTRG